MIANLESHSDIWLGTQFQHPTSTFNTWIKTQSQLLIQDPIQYSFQDSIQDLILTFDPKFNSKLDYNIWLRHLISDTNSDPTFNINSWPRTLCESQIGTWSTRNSTMYLQTFKSKSDTTWSWHLTQDLTPNFNTWIDLFFDSRRNFISDLEPDLRTRIWPRHPNPTLNSRPRIQISRILI